MTLSFSLDASGKSHIGMVRKTNQDSLLVDFKKKYFVVADGMGGHAGGEIASSMCVENTRKYIDEKLNNYTKNLEISDLNSILERAVNDSSARIYEKSLEMPNLKGMGTTATVFKIFNNTGFFGHVGDSRLYLLRCNYIYQLTQDHSLVSEQVAAGIITEKEAEVHRLRNVITRSVGYQEEEYVDTGYLTIEKSDFFILSSDGLHGKISDKEIANLVTQFETKAIDPLINLANERGGEDNISVIIIKIS